VKQSRKTEIIGIVVGALLMLSPLFAYCGYLIARNHAQALLGDPHGGKGQAMSANINAMLYSLSAGIAGFLAGVAILTCAIIAFRRARRGAGGITSV